jgi:hypothetical protein
MALKNAAQSKIINGKTSPTFQETWSEIIGTVRQVGKSHIVLLCSNEYVVKCDSQTIVNHRKILRKGALVGILRVEKNVGDKGSELRIRAISDGKATVDGEVL